MNSRRFEKVFHITLHVGKLSTYCEAIEHGAIISDLQIRNEVIPDLQVYAYQLANLFEENASVHYLARFVQLVAHYEDRRMPEESVEQHLERLKKGR